MRAPLLAILLVLAGCPDPTATPEGGGMTEGPMGGGAPGGPGAEGGQPGGGAGAPGGEGGAPPPGGGRPIAPGFQVTPGEGVKLTGSVAYAGTQTGTIKLDFLRNTNGGAMPDLVHSITLTAPGVWEVEAPKDAGEFWVVAFLDGNDNGPSMGEPAGRVKDAVKVGTAPVTGLDITLSDEPDLGDLKPGGGDGGAGKPGDPPPGGAPPGGAPPGGAAPGGAPPGGGALPGSAPPGTMGTPPAATPPAK